MDDAISAMFSAWNRPDSPGVVWAAQRDGQEILSGAVGMADIAQQTPMGRRSVIRIGSQTKQFTVLLALMLEQDGKLDMEDEVHRYAPWLPQYPNPITLRHLATNTSGLRDFLEIMTYGGLPLCAPTSRARQREMIAAHREVNFVPGTQMIYCNTGFMLLSEIVEEVSGRGFNELLEARITGPLGMADTRLMWRDSEIWPRLVAQHLQTPTGWQTTRWGFALGGEGGMVSTLEDMLIWQRNLDTPKVGSKHLFDRMATPVAYANGSTGKYGLGLTSEPYRGLRCIAHGGGVAGGKSESVRFPEAGLGIVLLANFDTIVPTSFTRRIADHVLGLAALPDRNEADLTGFYRQAGTGEVLAIQDHAGTPYFVSGGGACRMEQTAQGVFAPERATHDLSLSLQPDGALDGHFCGTPVRYEKLSSPAGPFPTIAGRYANAATGMAATIDDALQLRLGTDAGQIRLALRWIDRDLLAGAPESHTEAWPPRWTCTLRVVADGLVFETDRTKNLLLRRIADR
jgi:CubicO group peptidase (beta-lactamase class C family)